MLPVRSFKQGQVTSDEVRDLLARMRDAGEQKAGEILDGMAEIGSYAGDILVADAGLHVAGHLDLSQEKAWVLMVNGDLVVDGVFSDYLYGDDDDPGSCLLVTGDTRAGGVITAGWLEGPIPGCSIISIPSYCTLTMSPTRTAARCSGSTWASSASGSGTGHPCARPDHAAPRHRPRGFFVKNLEQAGRLASAQRRHHACPVPQRAREGHGCQAAGATIYSPSVARHGTRLLSRHACR